MLNEQRLRRILEMAREVVAQLDLETVLHRVVEEARALTGARYAALGVLDHERRELERFLTSGVDADTQRLLGELPRGHGVLGVLIAEPVPLRLLDVQEHPRSFGFPPGHPPMRTFLGVPVLVRGEVYGNLYLAEKDDGAPFDAADEEAIVMLAEWTGVAIANARAYEAEQEGRRASEQAVRALEATTAIARAVGVETDLGRVLALIVEQARLLVDARGVLILLREGDELVVASVAGEGVEHVLDVRVPYAGSVSGQAMQDGRVERVADLHDQLRFALGQRVGATSGAFVPLVYRGRSVGVLNAFDPRGGREFTPEDERLLESFAASAATAVATAQTVASDGLRRSIEASERERERWARELHDETLQELAALKVLLAGARRSGDREAGQRLLDEAVAQIDTEITGLRRMISDLRPAALDAFGVKSAVEGLVERVGATSGLEIELETDLAFESGRADARPEAAIENALYRLVQEGLTNVVKHAQATRVTITITQTQRTIGVRIEDDGRGFDGREPSEGFGLVGMRERAELLGGELTVVSGVGAGTTVTASIHLPLALRRPSGPRPPR